MLVIKQIMLYKLCDKFDDKITKMRKRYLYSRQLFGLKTDFQMSGKFPDDKKWKKGQKCSK